MIVCNGARVPIHLPYSGFSVVWRGNFNINEYCHNVLYDVYCTSNGMHGFVTYFAPSVAEREQYTDMSYIMRNPDCYYWPQWCASSFGWCHFYTRSAKLPSHCRTMHLSSPVSPLLKIENAILRKGRKRCSIIHTPNLSVLAVITGTVVRNNA